MLVEFSNIPVSLDAMLPHAADVLAREIARGCGISRRQAEEARIVRRSVDARKKSNVHFVVSVVVDVPDVADEADVARVAKRARRGVSARPYAAPEPLCAPDLSGIAEQDGFRRPVVVGAGPAGLFAALYLARCGLRPLVVERGKPVEQRQRDVDAFVAGGPLDPESNVQFGEGGAGTFSDGKLNTGTKSPHIRHVLEEFVSAGAPDDILVDAKPHIGTDLLPAVIRNIRKKIEDAGGEFAFSTRLVGIELNEVADAPTTPNVHAAVLEDTTTGIMRAVPTSAIVLAIGHSARDTFEMLRGAGVAMERKPFAVGVRIEHLQSAINRAQYGDAAGHPALGAADYKLAVRDDEGRGVYTFCMCPGGTVVAASSEPGCLCVNGMSAHARDGENANSALLAEVRPLDLPGDDVFAGINLQREMERAAFEAGRQATGEPYAAPMQTVGDFLAGRQGAPSTAVTPSYPRSHAWANLDEVFPPFVVKSFKQALPKLDRKLHGFADPQAVLTGVEPRSSSPVRMVRDRETLQSVALGGLYPTGEGAGYAGGIMSAATDGLRVAEAVARLYAGEA